jgi:hypothetical protein
MDLAMRLYDWLLFRHILAATVKRAPRPARSGPPKRARTTEHCASSAAGRGECARSSSFSSSPLGTWSANQGCEAAVPPAFEVERHENRIRHGSCDLDRLGGGEGEWPVADRINLGCAEVEERDPWLVAASDLSYVLVPDGVPGKVESARVDRRARERTRSPARGLRPQARAVPAWPSHRASASRVPRDRFVPTTKARLRCYRGARRRRAW